MITQITILLMVPALCFGNQFKNGGGMIDQIRQEYIAFYTYEWMSQCFARSSVGMLGFAKFFHEAADEEMQHARKMSDYLLKRGQTVDLKEIQAPSGQCPPNVKTAINMAIRLEQQVQHSIEQLHASTDSLSQHFYDDFLMEQAESIYKLQTLKSRLEVDQITVFLIDQELRSAHSIVN